MSRRSKLTDEERMQAVQEYLDGKGSYHAIAKKYNIIYERFRQMVIRAQTEGIESVKIQHTNRKYSAETKNAAVQEYLDGKGSQVEICKKYHIANDTILIQWIKCYNSGKDFKERKGSERGITMNKGRKTTQEERAEIVAFCIEHGKDYGLTIEKYNVSYQQVYAWVKKYEEKGIEGLSDGRGRTKPESEMTEVDKLKAEKKILEAKLKDKEMEIALLKKVKELERGHR